MIGVFVCSCRISLVRVIWYTFSQPTYSTHTHTTKPTQLRALATNAIVLLVFLLSVVPELAHTHARDRHAEMWNKAIIITD